MAVREPDVSPLTRHLLHAFLLVFVVTGIAHLELYPFSGFRLFSELRGEERTSWQLRGVDVESVRIYRTVASVRPDGPPPERRLVYECGGHAP